MAFLSTIPQATDRIKDSQPQILANFVAIPTLLEINHVGFVGGSDDGKHIKVDFTNSATHPLVDAGQILLYNNSNELYVKKAGALAVEGIPFTKSSNTLIGYSYLPSGLLIKWGFISVTGSQTITVPAVPPYSSVYNIQLTAITSSPTDTDKTIVLKAWSIALGSLLMDVRGVKRLSNNDTQVSVYWSIIGV